MILNLNPLYIKTYKYYIPSLYDIMLLIRDATIRNLLECEKTITESISRLHYKRHQFTNSTEAETILDSNNGVFKLRIRINNTIENDFSVILFWRDGERKWRVLTRYNGNSHSHTNRIENNKIDFTFHKHRITERYQELGGKEEDYAESTSDFNSLETAIDCIMRDCNIRYARNLLNSYI